MLGTRPFPNVIGSRPSVGSTALPTLYFHQTEDTDWDNGANWYEEITGSIQRNAVPTAAQHAIIQSGTCDADGTCASLLVASGGTLAFNGGTVNTNNGTVTNNGPTGTVTNNNGTVTDNNGGATVTNNNSGATVTENNGTVTNNNSGATVGTNNSTIVNAYSGCIIVNNSTGTITNDFR